MNCGTFDLKGIREFPFKVEPFRKTSQLGLKQILKQRMNGSVGSPCETSFLYQSEFVCRILKRFLCTYSDDWSLNFQMRNTRKSL